MKLKFLSRLENHLKSGTEKKIGPTRIFIVLPTKTSDTGKYLFLQNAWRTGQHASNVYGSAWGYRHYENKPATS